MDRKIYRSETDRMIGGVCGGIAEYFGMDSTIVRLVFALAVVYMGVGFPLYIILWIVVPTESAVFPGLHEKEKGGQKKAVKKVKSDSKK
jgi:phage shock protein PspC (stress-responsive transcriptional regulator)